MKYYYTVVFLFLASINSFAQQNYWQQEVNYTIAVTLNDQDHTLTATEQIEYINNSPDELTFIYFHLWPNAYKNNTTAFAKQQLTNKKRDFQFALDSARGYIDGLDFKVNNQSVKVEYDPENIDICKLILNQPLKIGQKIEITTPFRVKLPASFSRLGHVGQSYQITQWYPKPAVYDRKGWHPLPYLDQGEFYSEFGSFDVSITLPANYTVGATGVLQNTQEQQRLDSLATITAAKTTFKQTDLAFPPSAKQTKTLRYTQSNIHDFAWFADKRFNVLKSEVELPHAKRKVNTWLLFLSKDAATWVKSMKDINEAVYYYSLWNGDYPYAYATAVDGALSAGSGMEYPMVTVTDPVAIIHEVGHNWFYGILASNERQHPWLDEGINSYYESRVGQLSDPNHSQLSFIVKNKKFAKSFRLQNIHSTALNSLFYQAAASRGLDQPIEYPAAEYGLLNYGGTVYLKTGVMMQYLAAYLGQDKFDTGMKAYFERWKFKHPYPEDLQAILEEKSGEKLDWFFKDIIQTTNLVDPALTHIRQQNNSLVVTVQNNTRVLAPVPVAARDANGKILETRWTKPNLKEQEITFTTSEATDLVIDPSYLLPELNRHNNQIKTQGLLKKTEPVRLQFLAGIEQFDRNPIYFIPAIGHNSQDKFMLGAAFYNSSLFQKKLDLLALPLYSFGQRELRGIGNVSFNIFPENAVRSMALNLNYQRFVNYQKLEPSVTLNFRKPHIQSFSQKLKLAFLNIREQDFNRNEAGENVAGTTYRDNIPWLRYRAQQKNALRDISAQLDLDIIPVDDSLLSTQSWVKRINPVAKLTLQYSRYYNKKKQFGARFFAGKFFRKDAPMRDIYNLGLSHSYDYKKETVFLDRAQHNKNTTAFVRQTNNEDGGFRNYIPVYSNQWLTTLNLEADLPFVPLSAYLDLGTAAQVKQLYYGTGLSLSLVKNIFQIYLPIAGSNYAQDVPKNFKDFTNNIRFSLQLQNLNPFRLVSQGLEF